MAASMPALILCHLTDTQCHKELISVNLREMYFVSAVAVLSSAWYKVSVSWAVGSICHGVLPPPSSSSDLGVPSVSLFVPFSSL